MALTKIGGRQNLEDEYFDALVQLGELVVRAPPRGARLARLQAARHASEVLRNRRLELQMIEQAMDDAEEKVVVSKQIEDAERPELEKIYEANKGPAQGLDRKLAALKKNLVSRRSNLRFYIRAVEAQEKKVAALDEKGDTEQADAERSALKKMRLDHMRQESALRQVEEDMDIELQTEGRGGEGMRAKLRLEEFEASQKERFDELEATLESLDAQAEAKEAEIKATEEAVGDALTALGEEVYAQRIPDPRYQQVYALLDPLAQALAGK